MSFYDVMLKFKDRDLSDIMAKVNDDDIRRILSKERIDHNDFIYLLSPKARNHLDDMAIKANALTKSNFGNTMLLYTPMYISNHCINRCIYCGFNITNKDMPRKKLTLDEIQNESKFISGEGLKHVLLLTGESPIDSPLEYLSQSTSLLSKYFNSIGIEIYPLDINSYRTLINDGVTGLTVYQETYDEDIYDSIHISGPKKDYRYRLDAPERGCIAGMREVNIGALLGLSNPLIDAFFTGLHGEYLINKYSDVDIGISVPRIRPHGGESHSIREVEDATLVQIILATRLFLPRLGISLSTREDKSFRDNLIPLGITRMSAGVTTAVGGHTKNQDNSTEQFKISDDRSFEEIKESLHKRGYQPIHSDWLHF